MKRRLRLTTNQRVDIIKEYSEQLTPMRELAERYAMSRQAIYKIIKRAGIDTSKGKLQVSCTVCAKESYRHKSSIRKQLNLFCSIECYHAFLQAGNGFPYIQNRNSQRLARTLVSQYFALQEKHIVHHENRNALDNRLENLKVFANQGDHIRHHRGFDANPIWDGSLL